MDFFIANLIFFYPLIVQCVFSIGVNFKNDKNKAGNRLFL
jgi:hypothetical protein